MFHFTFLSVFFPAFSTLTSYPLAFFHLQPIVLVVPPLSALVTPASPSVEVVPGQSSVSL